MKLLFGIVFFLIDFAAFAFGVLLSLIGLGLLGEGTGEGNIKLIVENIGEISGINGQLVVLVLGVIIVAAALGYASKAFIEAIKYEHGLKDTIQHFNPGL